MNNARKKAFAIESLAEYLYWNGDKDEFTRREYLRDGLRSITTVFGIEIDNHCPYSLMYKLLGSNGLASQTEKCLTVWNEILKAEFFCDAVFDRYNYRMQKQD